MFASYKLIVISDEVECLASPLALMSSALNDNAKIRNQQRGIWHFCALTWTFMHLDILMYTFMTFLSGFSQIIKDCADLASGEILAVGVVASGCQLLAELGNAVDPTHQVAGGGARVAVGEVEERKLLFAVTTDFHNAGCLIVVVTLGLLMSNADVYNFFYGTYDA